MFGRKIPDKIMAPTGPSAGAEPSRTEKKPMSEPTSLPARPESPARRPSAGAVESIIGEDTSFIGGKIVSKGMLRIDGRVEGEILAEDAVVVGQTGAVKGPITARTVAVSGKVFGSVIAHERLEIQATGEIHGDFQTASGGLIIEGGAKIEGRCLMGIREKAPDNSGAPRPAVERRPPAEPPTRDPAPRPEIAAGRKPPAASNEL
ncbi:MAG: polymer-forming cytoskeletal protein [Candidatus Sumerlaeia bacterium]|nr:polymer-forming cytoskeletal protein [Candidatus Sumerlaeia bacterium]